MSPTKAALHELPYAFDPRMLVDREVKPRDKHHTLNNTQRT